MIRVPLTAKDVALSAAFARQCTLGGVSRVHHSILRAERLEEDQLVGQLGEMAWSKYQGGTPLFYELTRMQRNLHPDVGDGGADLLASNVDVKTSLMRTLQDPLRYRLAVRPTERHTDAVYVLALVPALPADECWLIGWCAEAQLPERVESSGVFQGAFVVPASHLHPLPPIRLNWEWNYGEVQCRTTVGSQMLT